MAELSKDINKPGVIAFYLPQYHPIQENNEWWGKGFTEWTNVGKAIPLFPGHYQPHVPADLGYYDLRVPETRKQQAEMAKLYGIDGFCYWHYWFGEGRQLLEKPFNDVLKSGEPEFPFCLGWANHSWKMKTWCSEGKKDKLLIEQRYPGVDDCITHFSMALKAFQDKRYLTINDKPIFLIWEPEALPIQFDYLKIWREQALLHGLKGITFIGFTYYSEKINIINNLGYDFVVYDGIIETSKNLRNFKNIYNKIIKRILGFPLIVDYLEYQKVIMKILSKSNALPCILPNFDHTPRSGKQGYLLKSSPALFANCLKIIRSNLKDGGIKSKEPIIFIKSWNEWGEGNHLEPDLKYSCAYLEALKSGISD